MPIFDPGPDISLMPIDLSECNGCQGNVLYGISPCLDALTFGKKTAVYLNHF